MHRDNHFLERSPCGLPAKLSNEGLEDFLKSVALYILVTSDVDMITQTHKPEANAMSSEPQTISPNYPN